MQYGIDIRVEIMGNLRNITFEKKTLFLFFIFSDVIQEGIDLNNYVFVNIHSN